MEREIMISLEHTIEFSELPEGAGISVCRLCGAEYLAEDWETGYVEPHWYCPMCE
jgi:hypothetical protein